MANCAYLCSSPLETIYPSLVQGDYDAATQTIACGTYCIPLLWLCLFRPSDIVRKEIYDIRTGVMVRHETVVTTRRRALNALDRVCPSITYIFRHRGDLGPYFDLFKLAIRNAPYDYISIDVREINDVRDIPDNFEDPKAKFDLYDWFYMLLKTANTTYKKKWDVYDWFYPILHSMEQFEDIGDMKTFDNIDSLEECMSRMIPLARLRVTGQFPPARLLLDNIEAPADDRWNFYQILGAGYLRPTPWEAPIVLSSIPCVIPEDHTYPLDLFRKLSKLSREEVMALSTDAKAIEEILALLLKFNPRAHESYRDKILQHLYPPQLDPKTYSDITPARFGSMIAGLCADEMYARDQLLDVVSKVASSFKQAESEFKWKDNQFELVLDMNAAIAQLARIIKDCSWLPIVEIAKEQADNYRQLKEKITAGRA